MRLSTSLPFVATIVLLGGTLWVGNVTARRIAEPLIEPLSHLDSKIAGWSSIGDYNLEPRTLRQLAPSDYLVRRYRKGNAQLDLFIAFYAQQRGGESMHSPKHCLPGAGWEIWKHDSALIPVDGMQIEVNKYSIQNAGNRMLMIYWYQSKDRIVASEYMGKVLLARDSLMSGHTAGSIVRIMLPDRPHAADEAVAFASVLIPRFHRAFGE
jgi:EpsI family protein